MAEVSKEECVTEDGKTVHIMVSGDHNTLKICSCDCNCNNGDGDNPGGDGDNPGGDGDNPGGDGDNPGGDEKPKEDGPTEMDLTLLGGNAKNTEFRCLKLIDGRYMLGGLVNTNMGLLATFDSNLILQDMRGVKDPDAGSIYFTDVISMGSGKYIAGAAGSASATRISFSDVILTSKSSWQHAAAASAFKQFIKTPDNFLGEASYIAAMKFAKNNIIASYDSNFNKLRYMATVAGDMRGVWADHDRVIAVGNVGGTSGYLLDMDVNLTVKKQIVFSTDKSCNFCKILKKSSGYIVVGEAVDSQSKRNIIILSLDQDLSITKKQLITGQGNHEVHSLTKRPGGGYLIAGGCGTLSSTGSEAYIIALDSALNIEKSLNFGGTKDDAAYGALQLRDGTYVVAGSTKSAGSGQDAFLATFRGEFIDLDKASMPKYSAIEVNGQPQYQVSSDIAFVINSTPTYVPQYNAPYAGALTIDRVNTTVFIDDLSGIQQDPNLVISGR